MKFRIWTYFANKIKSCDSFQISSPIVFDGNSRHKTICGGLLTLLALALCLIYFIILVTSPLKLGESTTQNSTDDDSNGGTEIPIGNLTFVATKDFKLVETYHNRYNHTDVFNITAADWSIGILFSAANYDPTYISVSFYYVYSNNNGGNQWVYLPPIYWSESFFKIGDPLRYQNYSIFAAVCPDITGIPLVFQADYF